MLTRNKIAFDPREAARWCRETRAGIAEMTGEELAGTLIGAGQYTSPTYRAFYRMARHEARTVRRWASVPAPGAGRQWAGEVVAAYNLLHAQVRAIAATGYGTGRVAPGVDESLAARDYAAAKSERDALWPVASGACGAAGLQVWHAADGSLALG